MNIEDVGKIIDKIDKSSISFFELDIENCHLKLDKSDTRRYEGTETSRIVENAPKEPSYILEKNNFSETALTSEKLEKTEDAEDDENITFVKSPIVGTFYDAPSPDSESYVKVGTKVKEGDIILLHDLYISSINAVDKLIPELLERGYMPVTVSELFYYHNIELHEGRVYSHAK